MGPDQKIRSKKSLQQDRKNDKQPQLAGAGLKNSH